MRFSPDFIDKVRDANDVVDIISQYTTFKNAGSNLMGLCPFPDHREKTPSFSVSPTKQAYFCFGCKKGGNAINFLMDYNGMSFVEAIETLAKRASIPLPKNEFYKKNPEKEEQTKTFLKLSLHAARFFRERLQELDTDSHVWKYIEKRGLSKETVEAFKLGYSPSEWSGFSDYLQNIKAPMSLASQLGLVKHKNNGYFDLFRDRLMFPILSPKGDVVGFGGRSLTEENQPKYLNSPESPIFHKGRILYGLNETAKYIRTEDFAIVVEGYMDLVMLYQYGFKNVVATLGTAFTDEHAKLLKRYTQNVITLFDSDNAGIQAQERSLPIMLAQGLLPKAIVMTEAKDPDEFLKQFGSDKLKEKFSHAQDLFFVVLDRIFKEYRDTPTQKVAIINQVAEYLMSVINPALKDLYVQELALRMSVGTDWIYRALKNVKIQPKSERELTQSTSESVTPSADEIENVKIRIQNPPKEDVFLVNLALYREEFLEEFLKEGLEDKLEASGLDQAFRWIRRYYEAYKSGQQEANFATLSSALCSVVEDVSYVLWHLDEKRFAGTDVEKLKNDCLQRVRERFVDKQAKNVLKQLKHDQTPEKLEQFMNIIKSKQALKSLKN